MAKIGPVKGRVLMQLGSGEPTEVGTFEIPMSAAYDAGVVKIGPSGDVREIMAVGFEDMARQLRSDAL